MGKGCSPVRVTSPVSSNHIVSLHPTQDVVVTFDQKEAVSMKSTSDFIETIQESMTYFKFGQKFDFSDWSKDSKLYLGNIEFDKGDSKPKVNLSVVLESPERNNVTVVNPKDCELKVDMGDIIEVIICEPTIEAITCKVIGGEKELLYDKHFQLSVEAGADTHAFCFGNPVRPFCLDTKKTTSIVSNLPDYKGAKKEFHFWFKLTKESLEKSRDLPSGSYAGGKIVFLVPNVGTVYQLDFLLDVRDKKRKKEKAAVKKKIIIPASNNAKKKKNKVHRPNKPLLTKVFKPEPYRPQKVSITQKIQPSLDSNCHWEWLHDYKPKKNSTTSFRAYKKIPPGAWEDTEGFIRTNRGDIIGYVDDGCGSEKDGLVGIYE